MVKDKFFNITLSIHILCGILGLIVICFVSETDHIRWNIGYIIGYLFLLSLSFSFFIPEKVSPKVKHYTRTYRGIYLLGIILFLFIPKGLFILLSILIECGSNSEKIAENEQYIIRLYVTDSLFDDYNEKRIYKKQGIIEKYIGSFDAGDVTPHKRYSIKSFHIDESNNMFIGNCHSLLDENPYSKDSIISFSIVRSIN